MPGSQPVSQFVNGKLLMRRGVFMHANPDNLLLQELERWQLNLAITFYSMHP